MALNLLQCANSMPCHRILTVVTECHNPSEAGVQNTKLLTAECKIGNKPEITQLLMLHLVCSHHQCCTASKPAWKLYLLRNFLQRQVADIHCKQNTTFLFKWLKLVTVTVTVTAVISSALPTR